MDERTEAFNRIKSLYWEWHIEEIGFKPVFNASDGKGLKEMVKYFFSLTEDATVESVEDMFRYITKHWDELDDYYKKNTRLRQINGNIHNIILFFRNGRTTKNKSGVSEDYLRKVVDGMRNTTTGE